MDPVNIGSFHYRGGAFFNTPIFNPDPKTNDQPLVPAQRVPGIITPAEQRLYIRDLLPQARASSNLIEFASESAFTNNARPQGDTSPVGAGEGEQKAESAFTFALSNAPVVTIAHWVPASRQVLSDAAMLQGHLSGRLLYGLKLEEEQEMLTGTGAAGELNGLNNQAAAYNRGVTNDTILDTLLKAQLQVSLSNYEASAYVLHPIDWFAAMLLKDTQNRYLFSDPQSMVQPRVWAKPVVASQTQTQGRFLCGAFSLGAQIWDKEDATVRISENVNDHFIRNMVAILAEERLALTVYRSTAFVYGNTSHAG
jgi:HK97 family phage major capsid protein